MVKFVFSRLFFCILVIAVIFTAIIFLCFYLHSLLPAALGAAGAYLISLIAALFLLLGDGRGDYKCAWLALIAALPAVGAILYAFSCTGGEQKREPALPPPLSAYDGCEYFEDGARYLERLTECVAEAKKRVLLEFYIISRGQVWDRLYAGLKEALERGVRVFIVYDGLGSASRAPVKDLKRLAAMGAGVKVFNKLLPFPVSRLNCRNHRKIAVTDGRAVFLGGVNIADEYANITSPHGYWKDGGVMLTGEIAARCEGIFFADFYGREVPALSQNTDLGENVERNNHCDGGDSRKSAGKNSGVAAGNRGDAEGRKVRIVADGPANIDGCCEELITAKIYSAQERVYIFTPYLCVGEKLKDALVYAAGKGVRVRVVIPEIPDKKITFELSLTYAAALIKSGVRIYRFKPGFMHAKCVVCDGEALLGSYNFDFRSMRLNYECGVWVGGEITALAASDFERTLALSAEICDKEISALRRVVRGGLKLFAPLF